jgi:tetratricopeptide (TPR) repeat protein
LFCKTAIFAIALASLVFHAETAGAAPVLHKAAEIFFGEIGVPAAASAIILRKIGVGAKNASCVADVPEGVYSFYATVSPRDKEIDVRTELNISRQNINASRARANLILAVVGGVDRGVYRDGDALGRVYVRYFSSRGFAGTQSASDAQDGWSMSLVWMERKTAELYRASPPVSADINDGYCAELYARAKDDFDAGRYRDALPAFKQIHDLKWANVGAYLDAAECFLKNGEAQESVKLLRELLKELGGDMGTEELKHAGSLFREAGDKQSAFEAYVLARERYHEGR